MVFVKQHWHRRLHWLKLFGCTFYNNERQSCAVQCKQENNWHQSGAFRRAINWINARYSLSESGMQSVHLQMRAPPDTPIFRALIFSPSSIRQYKHKLGWLSNGILVVYVMHYASSQQRSYAFWDFPCKHELIITVGINHLVLHALKLGLTHHIMLLINFRFPNS